MLPRLTLSRPADLVGLVPYLLGFHPTDSLVIVLLARGRVEVTARLDLAAADGEHLALSLPQMCAHVAAEEAVIVAYGSADDAEPVLVDAVDLMPCAVLDVLRVHEGRWWSLWCDDDACCPREGTPLEEAGEVAVQAVVAGLQALPSRDALVERVAEPTGEARERAAAALSEAIAEVAGMNPDDAAVEASTRVRRAVGARQQLDERERAELAVLVADVLVRDEVLLSIGPHNAPEHVELWTQVATSTVGAYASGPLAILAIAGWIVGNGALLSACLERGARVDPDYSFWFVLEDVVAHALPPSRWLEVVADAA